MDDEQKRAAFRERLSRQRRLSLFGAAAGVGGGALAQALPCAWRPAAYLAAIAAVATVLALTFRNWRCPNCGRVPGLRLDIEVCPRCGFKF